MCIWESVRDIDWGMGWILFPCEIARERFDVLYILV